MLVKKEAKSFLFIYFLSAWPDVDVRQQAVDEMMQRIKKGIQLRPVSQSANRTRRQVPSYSDMVYDPSDVCNT